jgi:hypothetical protein
MTPRRIQRKGIRAQQQREVAAGDQRSESLVSAELPRQFVEHLEHIVESPAAPEETEQHCLGGACGRSATVSGVLVARVPRQRRIAVSTGGATAWDGLSDKRKWSYDGTVWRMLLSTAWDEARTRRSM